MSATEQTFLLQELAAITDASPIGILSADREGRCTYINKTLADLLSLPREQALGQDWTSAIHHEDRQRVVNEWQTATAMCGPHTSSFRLRHPSDRIVWVELKSKPVSIDDQFTRFVATVEDVTARHDAEKARFMLSAILEASTDYVATTDFGGRVRYINPAGRRLRGLSLDADVSKTTIADYFPPWVVRCLVEEAAPQATRCGVWSGETAVWDGKGRELPIQHMLIAQKTPDGRIDFYASIMRDITAAQTAEKALRESRARLRLITNSMPALISYLDAQQRFQFANKTYQDWLNINPSEIIGLSLRDFYGEAVYATIQPYIQAALSGRQIIYERELVGAGKHRYVQVTLVPHRDERGVVVGLYSLINDISARRNAEQALRDSEARLRTMADSLPTRVSYYDAQERLRFSNRGYCQIYAQGREQLIGLSLREVIGEGIYRMVEPQVRRVLRGESIRFHLDLAGPENIRYHEARYIPQFAQDGTTVVGFHSLVDDITSQKQEELRLVKLSQTDGLTGADNRTGFQRRLDEAMLRSQTSGSLMGLMYIDIDRFKHINDRLGHGVGDLLLTAFARRLSSLVRSSDMVSRLGGDEFTIIMEGLGRPEHATVIAGKIVEATQLPFKLGSLGEQSVAITASIGLAFYQGGPTTAEMLVAQADHMLYQAKAAGRNNYHVASFNFTEGAQTETMSASSRSVAPTPY